MDIDLYTPETSDYAKGNNKFTGKIGKVTVDLKKTSAAEAAKKEVEEKVGEDYLDQD